MNSNSNIVSGWDTTFLSTINEVLDTLEYLKKNNWISRGQSKCWKKLVPKIDRPPFDKITSRIEKVALEKKSIDLLQTKEKFLSAYEETLNLHHDMNTLMVIQHFNGPTRLLDWSQSPYIAAFFSIYKDKDYDGELWAFQYDKYIEYGNEQWKKFKGVPLNSQIDVRYDYAFDKTVPSPDFFICVFNYIPFMRMIAQQGLFTFTANFETNHASKIQELFYGNRDYYHRYIISADIKTKFQKILSKDFGIDYSALFPDTAKIVKRINNKIIQSL